MKQILHSYSNGKTELIDVPCPRVKAGHVLIGTHVSLISAGTERMLMEFGGAGLLKKALRQPDKVRMVLDKIRTDGLLPTWEAVRSKLDKPVAMGYCNVGTVVEVGHGVTEFQIGDRVVSNGPHAEFACVGKNLCVKVPADVSDEAAAFTVLGAIALQSIRLAEPTLGESFAVIGLGLVGLLTVQLLKAHGCRVIGIDVSRERIDLARKFGAEAIDLSTERDPVAAARRFSRDRGIDGVIIAASTTSDVPIHQAAEMSRKRGRIVMLGVTGMQLSRADFYEKELSFQVSCSYGPGRYDSAYEEAGHDYPLPFVRWTEQRNFEAVLDRMAEKQIDAEALITHRFDLGCADEAYSLIGSTRPSLGVILKHRQQSQLQTHPASHTIRHSDVSSRARAAANGLGVGFIGAGEFATRVLMPAFRQCGARLESVASERGVSAVHAARKFGFPASTTDPQALIDSDNVDIVVVATRHNSHAEYVCRALRAGKHVFIEKPLALDREQLGQIIKAYEGTRATGCGPQLMVGFNRRFSPHVRTIKSLLKNVTVPKSFVYTVNAGAIPAEHWTHDPKQGGGRIVGEACHFIDLLRHLCGHRIIALQSTMLGGDTNRRADKATFTLQFSDGSLGTVHYLANGHRAVPKERLEIFCEGRIIQWENFRKLRTYGFGPHRKPVLWKQNRGHADEVRAFLEAVQQGVDSPINFDEAVEATCVSFDVVPAAVSGQKYEYSENDIWTLRHRDDEPPRQGQLARSA